MGQLMHDARNHLNVIISWAQLLRRRTQLDEDTREGLDAIARSGQALSQILEQLIEPAGTAAPPGATQRGPRASNEPTLVTPPPGDAAAPKSVDLSVRGLKIIVVDDHPDAVELACTVLRDGGADVAGAQSATQGLDLFRQLKPDVVVSDLSMPGQDGFQLIRKIRVAEGSRHTPAVALTAFAQPAYRERAISAGFDAYLTKPVEPQDLVRVVADVAQRMKPGGGDAPTSVNPT